MNEETILHKKLTKIKSVFNTEKLLSLKMDSRYVAKYYKVNQIPYSIFHTLSDKMYMGVSRDGVYKEDDLLEAARFVEKYSKNTHAKKVLELATGRGATSAYLARNNPRIRYDGIDISPGQLSFANKKARKLPNYHPVYGNYHDLSRYADNSYDIVFEIEAVCYSSHKETVLAQVYKKLKKGGVFLLFDGYAAKPTNQLSQDEREAKKLTERGMAVENFELYDSFIQKATQQGFFIDFQEDVSQYILPTLYRFEKLAKIYLKFSLLAKFGRKILPDIFIYNEISGYLMPDMIKRHVGCYYITVLKK